MRKHGSYGFQIWRLSRRNEETYKLHILSGLFKDNARMLVGIKKDLEDNLPDLTEVSPHSPEGPEETHEHSGY